MPKSMIGQGSSLRRASGPAWKLQSQLLAGSSCFGIVLLIPFWGIGLYNRIVRMENRVEQSWSNVDVVLQQRYDQFTSLVETVSGYAKHEKDLFMKFADVRMAASGASKGAISGEFRRTKHYWGRCSRKFTPLQNSTRTSKQMSPSSSKIKLAKSRTLSAIGRKPTMRK